MSATLQELDEAIQVAVQENNTEAVEELAVLIEQAESEQGYQPTDYNLSNELGKGLSRVGEGIRSLPEEAMLQLGKTSVEGGSPYQAIVPILGKGVGAYVTNPISEMLTFGGKTALELIPDTYEKAIADKAIDTFSSLMGTPAAQEATELGLQAAQQGMGKWVEFSRNFPVYADNIIGLIQIAEVYKPPALRNPVPMGSSELKRRGVDLQRQALDKTMQGKRDAMQQVLTKIDTKANRLEDVKNKRSDPETGRTYLTPTATDVEMYDVLIDQTDISPKNSNQRNLDIVNDTISIRGAKLVNELREYDYVKFNQDDVRGDMRGVLKGMLDPDSPNYNPALNNTTRVNAAKNLFTWVDAKLKKGEITPSRLYELRKELDSHIQSLKSDAFDGTATANSEAQKAVRSYLNSKVIEGAPFSNVATDLKEMHIMYKARDILEPKAAEDLDTSFGRALQNVSRVTDTVMPKTLGGKVNNIRLVTGAGTMALVGTLTPFLPYVAAGGGLGYLAYRGANSSFSRKKLGQALVAIDKAIKVTGSREMKEALALDRATLIEAMKLPLKDIDDPEEQGEEEEVRVPYRRQNI